MTARVAPFGTTPVATPKRADTKPDDDTTTVATTALVPLAVRDALPAGVGAPPPFNLFSFLKDAVGE